MKQHIINLFLPGLLLAFSPLAAANLILADGGPTGQWYNPERDGEGFYVEIIDTGGNLQISVAMYSYDAQGNQLWVIGNVAIDEDDEIVAVPVFQVEGPVWGPGYNPDDREFTDFGTITVRFPTCDTALFSIQTNVGLQNGNYSLVRLTDIVGVDCVEPPEPPPSGIRAGKWEGPGVCFMVSEDGGSIIGGNLSECDAQAAFDSNLEGISDELRECNVTASCEGVWPIVDGTFTCVNELGEMAIGTFDSTTSANGLAFEGEGGVGEFCSATWSASPD